MPLSKSITNYPTGGKKRTSQRRAVAYVSGSVANNNGGAVLTKGSVSSPIAAENGNTTKQIYGSQVINSDESGSKRVIGTQVGAVGETLKQNVINHTHGKLNKFTRDVSASPLRSGGWDFVSGQLISTRYIEMTGSAGYGNDFSVNSNGISQISGEVGRTALHGGSLQLVTTGTNALGRIADFSIAGQKEYVIKVGLALDVPTIFTVDSSEGTHTLGVDKFIFEISKAGDYVYSFPWVSADGTGMNFDMLVEYPGQVVAQYLTYLYFRQILSTDINTTFGTETDSFAYNHAGTKSINTPSWG